MADLRLEDLTPQERAELLAALDLFLELDEVEAVPLDDDGEEPDDEEDDDE